MKNVKLIALLGILTLLNACAAVVVGGAATGASAAHDRRTTGTFIEDEAIELKSLKAISDEKDLSSQIHINVTSFNTIVLVSGETPTEDLRRRVIEIIRNIPKVSHVHDELTIAGPSSLMSRSGDTLITTKVKTKLIAEKNLDGTHVKVVTENGVVYLMGLLNREDADKATEIARQTGGVQKVVKLFQYSSKE
ncbi:MAG: BON domain-containing protein [Gammaproteobacteria bacterium]|jgi:osmotically-inducible protein OsmY|nr:BON domain-containing protein [Gammaproteobacteria bacterium]